MRRGLERRPVLFLDLGCFGGPDGGPGTAWGDGWTNWKFFLDFRSRSGTSVEGIAIRT
jgi:hypothetical protein